MKLTDAQVRGVIADLRDRQERVTGATLRRELQDRYGSPGGVSRIYRLLRESPPVDPVRVAAVEQEILETRERAERAEAREEAHQRRWAADVDRLRQRVRELEAAEKDARRWHDAYQRVAIELQSMQLRLAEMERDRSRGS